MSDKNWIQKATKNMRKDKPCTGEKFGSETCPPGSKRYNLAKTFRKMAKEGHKLASLEKASVLSASDDPSDQDKAREIRVRHDYESLKKQIGSKKKPTKPAVNETKMPNVSSNDKKAIKSRAKNLFKRDLKGEHDGVNESVGGGVPMTPQELEIQKKMSRLNVRLAKKRNAQMMKAKVKDTESSPEQVKEAKLDKGRSDYGKATIRNWRHSGPSTVEPAMFDPENKRGKTIEKRREEHKARRGVKGAKVTTYKKEEVELDERLGGKGYSRKAAASSVYPGKKGTGDWEDSDRGAGNKAARRAGKKVEKKSPTYRAYVLNKEDYEVQKKKEVLAALKKRDLKKSAKEKIAADIVKRKGDTSKSDDRYAYEETILEKDLNAKERRALPDKDFVFPGKGEGPEGKQRGAYPIPDKKHARNALAMAAAHASPAKQAKVKAAVKKKFPGIKVSESTDKALDLVRASIIKKHGKGAIYDPKTAKKPSEADKKKAAAESKKRQAERKKRQEADSKAFAARAKKAGYKNPQDYANVVARYGSEDNYKKGRGLGT